MRLRTIAWSCSLCLAFLSCQNSERQFASPSDAGAANGVSEGGSGGSSTTEGGSPGRGEGDGGEGAEPGSDVPSPLACTEAQLVDLGSDLFTGTTDGQNDDFRASCFSAAGEDVAVEWIAPRSDYYRFTTAGSNYDTALALLQDECDGAELACNADASVPQAEIVQYVAAGERVVVVVDGKAGATGDVSLGIEAVDCPRLDLTEATLPIELSTQNQGDNSTVCGGAGASDRGLRFTPPRDGLYRFSASSEDFPTIVSVENGPVCGSPGLGCGHSFRVGEPAQLVRRLAKDAPVTVFVDGGSGTFELDIENISGTATCPSDTPAILLEDFRDPLVGNLAGAAHLLTGSCAPTGDFTPVASYAPLVERSYPLAVNLPSNLSCTITVTSASKFATYLLDGRECRGSELECALVDGGDSHQFTFDSADNGDYILVVEDAGAARGTFELSFACIL